MEAECLVPEIARLLDDTLSPEETLISSATEGLGRLSGTPGFARALLTIATGGEAREEGRRLAAATYLKNFTKGWIDCEDLPPEAYHEFRNQLLEALLRAEPAILKVLVEAFRFIVTKDFVRGNAWPELVPELKLVIQNSDLISGDSSQWKSINAMAVLQTIVKPFQYFLNPKLPKEPVPTQLELIAKEILVPLQTSFNRFIHKTLSFQGGMERETEQIILIICKCMYFTVRSYMPSALNPIFPSFCRELFRILDSLDLSSVGHGDGNLLRLKIGKRSLIIFSTFITRHRKHFDKLMPEIIDSSFKIAKHSINISEMDSLSERIISLALDVISHGLETGPGWRLVSPHFSTLLESAIFPALVLNDKDISEWEEDQEEYIRKNHPSDLEISEWTQDLFTARKSAINLLGVIALSKGPPMVSAANGSSSVKRKKGDKNKRKDKRSSVGELLVIPFLSKFPLPSDAQGTQSSYDYYGVLMAYGGLQDFLKERNPEYTTYLIRNRVLPLYSLCGCLPYLIATANWIIGELASCFPQEICENVYSSLMKALAMPDEEHCSCYPVRASAAGAIAQLLENDYLPPDWFSLLEVIAKRLNIGDENDSSLFFQLLSTVVEVGQQNVAIHIPMIVSSITDIILKHLPPIPEPWPQIVEHGFATLAVIAQTWDDSVLDEDNQNNTTKEVQLGRATIARSFSNMLQKAWLAPIQQKGGVDSRILHPPSCIDDASALVGYILRFVNGMNEVAELKIAELLVVWADLIAEYDAWEEMEDLKIFSSIEEAVLLHKKYDNDNFFMEKMPPCPLLFVPKRSIMEGIGTFVSKAISAYPSATRRACTCVHLLLHAPRFSFESENIKHALAILFSQAAFSHFRKIRNETTSLWKPLLLGISSCYLCCPDIIEKVLGDIEENSFTVWACAMAQISNSSFEFSLASESEIKLAAMTLTKVVERLLRSNLDMGIEALHYCFVSLMEVSIRLKEVQEDEEEEDDDDDDDDVENNDDSSEDSDEDSEDEREETEEEFLDRYAKAVSTVENVILAEGDVEDEVQKLELGALDEVDIHKAVFSLVQRHHQVLLGGQLLPSPLITGILHTFPEYGLYFQSSS